LLYSSADRGTVLYSVKKWKFFLESYSMFVKCHFSSLPSRNYCHCATKLWNSFSCSCTKEMQKWLRPMETV